MRSTRRVMDPFGSSGPADPAIESIRLQVAVNIVASHAVGADWSDRFRARLRLGDQGRLGSRPLREALAFQALVIAGTAAPTNAATGTESAAAALLSSVGRSTSSILRGSGPEPSVFGERSGAARVALASAMRRMSDAFLAVAEDVGGPNLRPALLGEERRMTTKLASATHAGLRITRYREAVASAAARVLDGEHIATALAGDFPAIAGIRVPGEPPLEYVDDRHGQASPVVERFRKAVFASAVDSRLTDIALADMAGDGALLGSGAASASSRGRQAARDLASTAAAWALLDQAMESAEFQGIVAPLRSQPAPDGAGARGAGPSMDSLG